LAVDQPFRAIIRVFGMVRRVMEPYFAKFGVSGPQWGVLRALHRAEDDGESSVPMTDLSDRLLIRPPSVTTMVAQLVRMGLIKRRTSAEDARVKEVSLSPSGRRLVVRVLANHQTQINTIMAGLEERERQELGRLLGRLAEHLETMVDQPASAVKTNGNKLRGSAVTKQRRGRS
jgi:DNA-binding MarR family transcriptional regulator